MSQLLLPFFIGLNNNNNIPTDKINVNNLELIYFELDNLCLKICYLNQF